MQIPFFSRVKARFGSRDQIAVQLNGKFLGNIDRKVAELLESEHNFDLVVVPGKLLNFLREAEPEWTELTVFSQNAPFKFMLARKREGSPRVLLASTAGVPISPEFLDAESLCKWCMDVFADTFGFALSEQIRQAARP